MKASPPPVLEASALEAPVQKSNLEVPIMIQPPFDAPPKPNVRNHRPSNRYIAPAMLAMIATMAIAADPNVATAGEVSPQQSPARPYGLQPYALVQKRASDPRSVDFVNNYLPAFRKIVNETLAESANFQGRAGFKLDPSRLFLRTESDLPIRVYFIHEGAGYRNSLGFWVTPAGSENIGQPYLIFPDASFKNPNKTDGRNENEPLVVGDFVELHTGGPGLQLDFFLLADGAKRQSDGSYEPRHIWFNNIEWNEDGVQHVVAFLLPDTRYVMIGFEDLLNGGDKDYNDCLFVIDIGEVNAKNLFDIESTLPE